MMELWITLPDDFEERFVEFRKSLEKAEIIPPQGSFSWDSLKSELVIGERRVSIPVGTNQAVICDALFDRPHGQWLLDMEVRHSYSKEKETSMYSAIRALNKASEKGFGIKDLFEFRKDRARIRTENLTQNF